MRIVLFGFGTVGQSFARILIKDREWLVKTYGFEPQITTIVDSQGSCNNERGLDLEQVLKVKKRFGTVRKYPSKGEARKTASEILSETEAETMVETMPSNFKDGEPGLSNIKQALINRKHVVTTDKGPLALAMSALLELAGHRRLQLRFSGTVGAGTPFLSFASRCLLGDRILGIHGILNGTTNYILTRMEEGALDFRRALAEAQRKGFAERDPTNDVEGLDTAAKMVIIANWIVGLRISIHDLPIDGISKITPDQIRKARASGKSVKLIGRLSERKASVGPEEISLNDPICVPETLNALTFSIENAGDVTLIGQGAGGDQTASAIMRDLVDIRREFSS